MTQRFDLIGCTFSLKERALMAGVFITLLTDEYIDQQFGPASQTGEELRALRNKLAEMFAQYEGLVAFHNEIIISKKDKP